MSNPGYVMVRAVQFAVACAFVCFGLLICAIGAFLAGSSLAEIRDNTQGNFLHFVEGWSL